MRKQPKFKTDMILCLRIKFVAVAMAILILVFLIMLSSINMLMQTVSQSQSHRLLVQIAESERYDRLPEEEELPPPPPEGELPLIEADVIEVQPLANRNWWEEDWEEETQPDDWEGGWGDWEEPTRPERPTRPWEETFPPQETFPPMTGEPPPPPFEPVVTTTATTQTQPPDPTESDVPVIVPVDPTIPPTDAPTEGQTTPEETTTSTTTTTTTVVTTPPPPPPEPEQNKWNITITLDHFAMMVGHNGEYLGLRNTEDYTSEEAQQIMQGILHHEDDRGMYGWLQYYITPKDYGQLIVLTDKTAEQGLLNQLFLITVIVGCIVLLILFVTLCILSKWITNPVKTAFTRQKQFVSDAGHELKTPLTILSANADILQDEIGENKWLGYMKEQTGRMNQLVGDLLRLARMDNATQEYVFEEFNLSTAINATVLPFESQAFELSKNLELDIQPGILYTGSEQHIRQLAAIFVDNALKYSDENGIIKVTLLKRGDQIVMEFYNTGCEISQTETEKIFERFYRGDEARGNTGKNGYGLGLAIARSIMEIHKIKIQVTCEQNAWIRFLLTL